MKTVEEEYTYLRNNFKFNSENPNHREIVNLINQINELDAQIKENKNKYLGTIVHRKDRYDLKRTALVLLMNDAYVKETESPSVF